jgi:hypothetical protein
MSFTSPKSWLMKPCALVLSGSRLSRLNTGELEDWVLSLDSVYEKATQ